MLHVNYVTKSGPPDRSPAAGTFRVSVNYEPDVVIHGKADSRLLFAFRDGHRKFPITGRTVLFRLLDMADRVVHEGFAEPDSDRSDVGSILIRPSDVSSSGPGHYRLEFFHDDPVGTRTAIQTASGRFGIPCRIL